MTFWFFAWPCVYVLSVGVSRERHCTWGFSKNLWRQSPFNAVTGYLWLEIARFGIFFSSFSTECSIFKADCSLKINSSDSKVTSFASFSSLLFVWKARKSDSALTAARSSLWTFRETTKSHSDVNRIWSCWWHTNGVLKIPSRDFFSSSFPFLLCKNEKFTAKLNSSADQLTKSFARCEWKYFSFNFRKSFYNIVKRSLVGSFLLFVASSQQKIS